MKSETKLKVDHYNCWEVWVNLVECRIEQHGDIFYSYIFEQQKNCQPFNILP